jgi:hypothetical protein
MASSICWPHCSALRSAFLRAISCSEASRVYDNEVYDRAIDIQVLRLRRKIEPDPAQPRFIVTERGAGYIFSSPVEIVY